VPTDDQIEPARIGVDVGGTFTDLVADLGGRILVAKVPSTPPDFEHGVAHALREVAIHAYDLVHGSTVATNALLEGKVPPVGLVTNDGFADVLQIGRQDRPELYVFHVEHRPNLVTPGLALGVPGRLDAKGNVLEPLDEPAVRRIAADLAERGIADVAVSLLFSFVSDMHEKRVAQILDEAGLRATLSSRVAREFREYERASTTAVTAALRPVVGGYLERLREALPGTCRSLRVLHGGGGTFDPDEAELNAARLILSGPAGGAIGAALVAEACGYDEAVSLDVGGTSTDVALVTDRRVATRSDHRVAGHPIRLPMLDISTVGAGGGSIARLDAGSGLQVGPRSAGADPGPACYGRGGTEPTVTDAHLLLGHLDSATALAGVALDAEAAARSFEVIAKRLELSIKATAAGVLKLADRHMADALLRMTAGRGHDARRLPIVGFGGAGGLHACRVAEQVGSGVVLLPPMAGVLSALGMVAAAPSADAARTVLPLEINGVLDDDRLYAEFGSLNAGLFDAVPAADLAGVEAFADCRWQGQSHELTVRATRPTRAEIERSFRSEYDRIYGDGAIMSDAVLEVVTLRIRRIGRLPTISLPPLPGDHPRVREMRKRERIGPFVIRDADATLLVPEGWRARLHETGTIICERT
jgi:N-methylhydantoinase A